ARIAARPSWAPPARAWVLAAADTGPNQEQSTMNEQTLKAPAAALTATGKGLLAMDESNPTADKRFAALGIPQTPEMRRACRDMIVTAPGLSESIGGAILYDETIRTRTFADVPFAQALEKVGIVPGIKVDA